MIEPKRKTLKASQAYASYDKNKNWEYEVDVYETAGTVNVDNKIVKVGKGFAPHGGIILKNISNQGYRMAYDIGIVGIYITPIEKIRKPENGGHATKFLVLGPPDFIQLDDDYKILKEDKTFDPFVTSKRKPFFDKLGYNMNTFNDHTESEVLVKYRSKNEMFGDGSGYLIVEQKFIFTSYDDEPAHEPTGGIMAARLHPIVRLYFEKPPRRETVESFRVDYRLYINLDKWLTIEKDYEESGMRMRTREVMVMQKSTGKVNNAAGVFKDVNDFTQYSYADLGLNMNTPERLVFSAAEKPLISEIIAEGLNPNYSDRWYNIHWWGAGKSWTAGSAPGSFHAVHIHWRWADEIQIKRDNKGPDPKYEGYPQFIGKGIGGELTDPAIGRQKLQIAVVKDNSLFYSDQKKEAKGYLYNYVAFGEKNKIFGDIFKSINATPAKLDNGEDIVLYYSVEIKLSECKKNSNGALDCSLFVHGLFFAHEPEKKSMLAGNVGTFYKNPKKPNPKAWTRNPEK